MDDTSYRRAFDDLLESDPTFKDFAASFVQLDDERKQEILDLIRRVIAEPDPAVRMAILRGALGN